MTHFTKRQMDLQKEKIDFWNSHEPTNELFRAVHNNDIELAQRSIDNGAYIDGIDQTSSLRWTPLLIAFNLSRDDMFRFLLAKGADKSYTLTDGRDIEKIETIRRDNEEAARKSEIRKRKEQTTNPEFFNN